jgi:hypothetical protein
MTKKKLPTFGSQILGLAPDGSAPGTVLDMLNVGKPAPKRRREWEKRNLSRSFRIPGALIAEYEKVLDEILEIMEFDEKGNPRNDQTTVDRVLSVLLDWGINEVEKNPRLLPVSSNPHGKGPMTVHIEAWNTWATGPVRRKHSKHKREKKPKSRVISHRIEESLYKRLMALTDQNSDVASGPQKYSIPPGELLLKIARIAIDAYFQHRAFRFVIKHTATQEIAGWEKTQK